MTAAVVLAGLAGAAGVMVFPSLLSDRSRDAAPRRGDAGHREREPSDASRSSRGRIATVVVALFVAGVALFGPLRGTAVAAGLVPVALAGLRVASRHRARERVDPSLALVLDLAAAALRGGRPVTDALTLAAPVASPAVRPDLLRVAGLLRLGADAARAWADARDGPLSEIAVMAVRSSASGIRLADALERAAVEARAESALAAATRAQRAGVAAMGPLAACFLPSFVCLGIVPVIIGIARSALGGLP